MYYIVTGTAGFSSGVTHLRTLSFTETGRGA